MLDEVADLEPQTDADTSPAAYVDRSIDTSPELPEVDAEGSEVEVEEESEAESSPAEVEVLEEKADSDPAFSENVKTRIDKLTSDFRGAERRGDDLQRQLDDANARLAEVPEVVEPLKSLEDFDYDQARYDQYRDERSDRRAEATARKIMQETRQTEQAESVADKFDAQETAFAKDNPDYFDVTRSRELKISPAMKTELELSDIGTDIAYYLGKTEDGQSEAARISRLSPREVVREMMTLEGNIRAEQAKAKETKKVSDAPPPPPSIKSGDEGRRKKITDSDLSDADFRKMRRKQIAAR